MLNMINKYSISPAAVLVVGCCFNYTAQAAGDGIRFGPVDVYPYAGITQEYDDNIHSLNKELEKDSWITVYRTGVRAVARERVNSYSIGYGAEVGRYADSSDDNYEDQNLSGGVHIEPNSRNRFDLTARYTDTHDTRGTRRTEGILPTGDPDEWHGTDVRGVYGFGSKAAKMNLDFAAGLFQKRYDNNLEFTKAYDRDDTVFGITSFYRVLPKVFLLFQVQNTGIDYVSESSLDSDEQRYLAGVRWRASAKTSGTLRFGRLEKDFDAEDRSDYSGETWELAAHWAPRSYSSFHLLSSRKTEETYGAGDYVLSESIQGTWLHRWNDRLSSDMGVSVFNYDYNPEGRTDDVYRYGASLNYKFRRWLTSGLGYRYFDRNSDVDVLDYSKNVYSLSLLGEF